MKTTIIGFILAASGTLLLASCAGETEATDAKEEVLDQLVVLADVEQKAYTHEIRVQGNVETDQDVTLSAEMGGLITSINVKEGQMVSKGSIIAQVDASVLSSNAQELQTKLEYAKYMLGKQEELQKRGVGSEFDLEAAKSQVNSLNASLRSLNTQRGKAVIRAPFTGVIDQVYAHQGQMAGPSSPIVRLVNNAKIDIVATISEKHFARVKIGTPIRVSFPNYTDTSIALNISNVGNYIEPTNRTFRIMASIPNNKLFLPNMLAEVSITDMNVADGTVIPSRSILKDQNNKDFVYMASSTKAAGKELFKVKKVFVTIISSYEGQTLIEANKDVKKGGQIVVDGARGIADGDNVRTK